MIDVSRIKAILFDSGRVLNRPRTGNWFLPPKFFDYINRDVYESYPDKLLDKSFQKGLKYLLSKNLIVSEEEELEHFCQFYRLFLLKLPGVSIGEYEIRKIAEDTVLNDEKFFFYEDVIDVIPRLRQRYLLGVVSDTWPSLDRVFKNVGLREYFSTFVMSSVLGITKPHARMYKKALEELELRPEQVLFIDDSVRNIKGARKLGIQTLLMLRTDNPDLSHIRHEHITDLNNLVQLLGIE
jgi:putative hydrolase of the HAD superfamily